MRKLEYEIPEGTLFCEFFKEHWRAEDLFSVVSRDNPNRQFLFASTILCRHLPARPSKLRAACRDLAGLLPEPRNKTLFVGFAETATALGLVLAEEARRKNSLYICTTRHDFGMTVLAETTEAHSHAPDHILYRPDYPLDGIWDLVLVDDEYTTSRTAEALARAISRKISVGSVTYASLLDWSGKPGHVSLCSGRCSFRKRHAHAFPEKPEKGEEIKPPRGTWGRFGAQGKRKAPDVGFVAGEKVLCVGRGEYAIDAFLAAEQAEGMGAEALCCATTRSPIRKGGTVRSVLRLKNEFGLPYHEYLYNADPADFDRVLLFSETGRADGELLEYFGGKAETYVEPADLCRPGRDAFQVTPPHRGFCAAYSPCPLEGRAAAGI